MTQTPVLKTGINMPLWEFMNTEYQAKDLVFSLSEDMIWKHAKNVRYQLPMEECSYLRNSSVIKRNFEKMSNDI